MKSQIHSAADIDSVPAELVRYFNPIFCDSVEDAMFKAMGLEQPKVKGGYKYEKLC